MAKKKKGGNNKRDPTLANNGSGRPHKKQKRNKSTPPRSEESSVASVPVSRSEQSTQSIAANDDFISLDLDDLHAVDISTGVNSRKRKRFQAEQDNDGDDDDEDLTMFPWLPFKRSGTSSPRPSVKRVLEDETASLLAYLEPTKAEITMRKYLIHKIRLAVGKLYPDAEVEVFGSFNTNLYLPNSDLDLVVQGNARLRILARELQRAGICSNAQVIEKATVPVIKFEDSLTKLKVDITLDSDSGIRSAKCIHSMIKQQRGLRPLTLLIKLFLALRKHNEVFTGGFGGYAIVCMVMSFLQMHPKVAAGEIDVMANLGTLLLDFLQLYGIAFQFEDLGISVVNKGSYFAKRSNVRSRNGKPVYSIEDPMDSSNDIAAKSYNATHIIRAFKSAYMLLTHRAFELEKMFSQNMLNPNQRNGLQRSILCKVFYIPKDMALLRENIMHAFQNRLWDKEDAASSFDWNAM